MMAICDIYDALCASDRPYRIAATHERALDILTKMRDDCELDGLLLDIFIARRVYQVLRHRGRNTVPPRPFL
jgi:HD-GYP domain-containing protein (c-di-GMP phosphodiesterase class II)